jgi:hypothetical protein
MKGWNLEVASSGSEALTALDKNTYDAITSERPYRSLEIVQLLELE